jgi:hypothetical protein
MQVVEHVGSAQELQEPEARVPGQVHKGERVQPERDLDNDDADLCQ